MVTSKMMETRTGGRGVGAGVGEGVGAKVGLNVGAGVGASGVGTTWGEGVGRVVVGVGSSSSSPMGTGAKVGSPLSPVEVVEDASACNCVGREGGRRRGDAVSEWAPSCMWTMQTGKGVRWRRCKAP